MSDVPRYEAFKDELAKTGVISDEFKSLLLSYGFSIHQEAYRLGQEHERARRQEKDTETEAVERRVTTSSYNLGDKVRVMVDGWTVGMASRDKADGANKWRFSCVPYSSTRSLHPDLDSVKRYALHRYETKQAS